MKPFCPSSLHRRLFWGLLLAGLALRLIPALDHQRFSPLIDDSFYAFTIARNIAAGEGITYAGEWTNGFQPLFVFLCVPFFAVAGPHEAWAIHAILTMMAVVGAATGAVIYALMRRLGADSGALVALTLWTMSPYFVGHGVNGLETGLPPLFLAASAWLYAALRERAETGLRAAAVLGLLLGLGVLARIDMGLWALALAVDWLFAGRAQSLRRRVALLAVTTACALLVTSPWWLFNLLRFGHFLPTSGSGVRFISLAMGYHYWGRPGEFLDPAAVPPAYYLLSLRAAVRDGLAAVVVPLTLFTTRGFLILVAAAVLALRRDIWTWLRRRPLWVLFPVLQVAAYAFWIFGQWFYPRYLVPSVWVGCLALAGLVEAAVRRLPETRKIVPGICLGLAIVMAFLSWNSWPQLWWRGEGNAADEHGQGVRLAAGAVPPGARLGGFQSGALEFYGRDWEVINLDGVVNAAAHEAMRAHRMDAYMRERDIDWLIELDWILEALYVRHAGVSNPMAQWELIRRTGAMGLYRRRPDAPSPIPNL